MNPFGGESKVEIMRATGRQALPDLRRASMPKLELGAARPDRVNKHESEHFFRFRFGKRCWDAYF